MGRQRKYADAQRVKVLADELERRERRKLEDDRLASAEGREGKFREKQGQEVAALLKRIEGRRAEHLKQREVDTRRLLQRNRNVMAVLEQRQLAEEQRHVASIKAALHPNKTLSPAGRAGGGSLTSAMASLRVGGDGDGSPRPGSARAAGFRTASSGGASPRSAGGSAAASSKIASRLGLSGGGAPGSGSAGGSPRGSGGAYATTPSRPGGGSAGPASPLVARGVSGGGASGAYGVGSPAAAAAMAGGR
jgi:hypothetical protein